jgi:hypothetical protein
VLLAYDSPSSSLSAGWARYILERRWKQPITTVRNSSLGRVDLAAYDVFVLPSGNYNYSDDQVRRLRDWIQRGGTLVTMGDSSTWATRHGLLSSWRLLADGSADVPAGGNNAAKAPAKVDPANFDYEKAVQPDRSDPPTTSGAILRVALDKEHWLTAGLDAEIAVVVDSSRVFHPLKLDEGTNVGTYVKERDRIVAAGLVWPEAKDLLSQKAYLMHQPMGQGHVIAFAEDPNYRAFTEATQLLFINAILLSGGH